MTDRELLERYAELNNLTINNQLSETTEFLAFKAEHSAKELYNSIATSLNNTLRLIKDRISKEQESPN